MLTITLTAKQKAQLSNETRGSEVTVTLTKEQYQKIKRYFPELTVMKMTITLSKEGVAAPFIPGGAVVTAAISSVSGTRGAEGSLTSSSSG